MPHTAFQRLKSQLPQLQLLLQQILPAADVAAAVAAASAGAAAALIFASYLALAGSPAVAAADPHPGGVRVSLTPARTVVRFGHRSPEITCQADVDQSAQPFATESPTAMPQAVNAGAASNAPPSTSPTSPDAEQRQSAATGPTASNANATTSVFLALEDVTRGALIAARWFPVGDSGSLANRSQLRPAKLRFRLINVQQSIELRCRAFTRERKQEHASSVATVLVEVGSAECCKNQHQQQQQQQQQQHQSTNQLSDQELRQQYSFEQTHQQQQQHQHQQKQKRHQTGHQKQLQHRRQCTCIVCPPGYRGRQPNEKRVAVRVPANPDAKFAAVNAAVNHTVTAVVHPGRSLRNAFVHRQPHDDTIQKRPSSDSFLNASVTASVGEGRREVDFDVADQPRATKSADRNDSPSKTALSNSYNPLNRATPGNEEQPLLSSLTYDSDPTDLVPRCQPLIRADRCESYENACDPSRCRTFCEASELPVLSAAYRRYSRHLYTNAVQEGAEGHAEPTQDDNVVASGDARLTPTQGWHQPLAVLHGSEENLGETSQRVSYGSAEDVAFTDVPADVHPDALLSAVAAPTAVSAVVSGSSAGTAEFVASGVSLTTAEENLPIVSKDSLTPNFTERRGEQSKPLLANSIAVILDDELAVVFVAELRDRTCYSCPVVAGGAPPSRLAITLLVALLVLVSGALTVVGGLCVYDWWKHRDPATPIMPAAARQSGSPRHNETEPTSINAAAARRAECDHPPTYLDAHQADLQRVGSAPPVYSTLARTQTATTPVAVTATLAAVTRS